MKEEDLNCVCMHTPTLNVEGAGAAMALITFDTAVKELLLGYLIARSPLKNRLG
jgi:hypothetical protein